MAITSLWAEIPSDDLRTPFTILKEQATVLSEISHGVLAGDIQRKFIQEPFFKIVLQIDSVMASKFQSKDGSYTLLRFKIVAPALDNYSYSLLEVLYPANLYPLVLRNLTIDASEKLYKSEEDFEEGLKDILASRQVARVLAALLADSRESNTSTEWIGKV